MKSLKKLLELCWANDQKSQRELFNLMRGRLMGICTRYADNFQEAQDIFQESVIKVFENLDRGMEMENFFGWIRKICINTAIDYYKYKKKVNLQRNIYENDEIQFEDAEATALASMEAKEILLLLLSLPNTQRMVFNLYMIEGYSHKEVAGMVNITESSSRALLSKARKKIISLLKKNEINETVYG